MKVKLTLNLRRKKYVCIEGGANLNPKFNGSCSFKSSDMHEWCNSWPAVSKILLTLRKQLQKMWIRCVCAGGEGLKSML